MKRAMVVMVVAALTGACRGGAQPASEAATTAGPRTEVVLSSAAQQEGGIETQPAKATTEPEMLRVSGRIALADTRTWSRPARAMTST